VAPQTVGAKWPRQKVARNQTAMWDDPLHINVKFDVICQKRSEWMVDIACGNGISQMMVYAILKSMQETETEC
jgi:hypothetical protein